MKNINLIQHQTVSVVYDNKRMRWKRNREDPSNMLIYESFMTRKPQIFRLELSI